MPPLICRCCVVTTHPIPVESATAETRKEILKELENGMLLRWVRLSILRHIYCTGIEKKFATSVDQLKEEAEIALLEQIAETGMVGYYPRGADMQRRVNSLMTRNANETLLCKAGASNVKIHRYSHALYLHNVTRLSETEVVNKVKQQFLMKES